MILSSEHRDKLHKVSIVMSQVVTDLERSQEKKYLEKSLNNLKWVIRTHDLRRLKEKN